LDLTERAKFRSTGTTVGEFKMGICQVLRRRLLRPAMVISGSEPMQDWSVLMEFVSFPGLRQPKKNFPATRFSLSLVQPMAACGLELRKDWLDGTAARLPPITIWPIVLAVSSRALRETFGS